MDSIDHTDASFSEESDESTEIQSFIDIHSKEDESSRLDKREIQSNRNSNNRKKRHKKSKQNSLDHLRQRVTELMRIFEDRGIFLPPPESLSEKGKVWSNRNYGADKKRQRKNAERQLLINRIEQLELCLKEKHGLDV